METNGDNFVAPDMCILVALDTPVNIVMFKGLLKNTQIQIDTAESGEECLEYAAKMKYHIIFVDTQLMDMNGKLILRHIKEDKTSKNQETPVIAMISDASEIDDIDTDDMDTNDMDTDDMDTDDMDTDDMDTDDMGTDNVNIDNVNTDDMEASSKESDKARFSGYLELPIDGRELKKLVKQYLPNQQKNNKNSDRAQSDAEWLEQISKLDGIDIQAGIQACATEEIYISVVKEFYPPAEKQAAMIERYYCDNDYKNYTILVHSLKSSARLIGAVALSEQARMLEMCGYTMQENMSASESVSITENSSTSESVSITENQSTSESMSVMKNVSASEDAQAHENAQEQALTDIQRVTPELLRTYRAYAVQLRDIFEPKEKEAAKPLIADQMLCEALEALRELVEGFDYDSADAIMDTLMKYRMPDYFKEIYQELKSLMAEVARDDIIREINAFLSREEH